MNAICPSICHKTYYHDKFLQGLSQSIVIMNRMKVQKYTSDYSFTKETKKLARLLYKFFAKSHSLKIEQENSDRLNICSHFSFRVFDAYN